MARASRGPSQASGFSLWPAGAGQDRESGCLAPEAALGTLCTPSTDPGCQPQAGPPPTLVPDASRLLRALPRTLSGASHPHPSLPGSAPQARDPRPSSLLTFRTLPGPFRASPALTPQTFPLRVQDTAHPSSLRISPFCRSPCASSHFPSYLWA